MYSFWPKFKHLSMICCRFDEVCTRMFSMEQETEELRKALRLGTSADTTRPDASTSPCPDASTDFTSRYCFNIHKYIYICMLIN